MTGIADSIVPAGILIGLGVGLLVDYLLSGFFIGLGLGLICSELFRLIEKSREAESTQPGSANVTTLLIGTFLFDRQDLLNNHQFFLFIDLIKNSIPSGNV